MSAEIAEQFAEAAGAELEKARQGLAQVISNFDDKINELEETVGSLESDLEDAREDLEPVQKALARLVMAVEDYAVRGLVDRDELLTIAEHCENLEAMAGVTI